jgi:MoxR-like ATPase
MRFEGTSNYVATDDLKVAVNAAVTLRRPLLVKGEPGTGKTVLAHEIARAVGAPLIEWHVKSTTKAHQGLYEYDAVARLRDGQLGDRASTTSPTTSAAANCGKRSPLPSCPCC